MECEAMRYFANNPAFPGTSEEKLKQAVAEFQYGCRVASLAEERYHHDQTTVMQGDKAPIAVHHQAAISVIRLEKSWINLGLQASHVKQHLFALQIELQTRIIQSVQRNPQSPQFVSWYIGLFTWFDNDFSLQFTTLKES